MLFCINSLHFVENYPRLQSFCSNKCLSNTILSSLLLTIVTVSNFAILGGRNTAFSFSMCKNIYVGEIFTESMKPNVNKLNAKSTIKKRLYLNESKTALWPSFILSIRSSSSIALNCFTLYFESLVMSMPCLYQRTCRWAPSMMQFSLTVQPSITWVGCKGSITLGGSTVQISFNVKKWSFRKLFMTTYENTLTKWKSWIEGWK